MSKIHIYLAGPISGETDDGANMWREMFTEAMAAVNPDFIGVNPLRCEPPGDDGMYAEDYSWQLAHEITAKNMLDVKRCDAVLAYLPRDNSIGTLQEIGWAVGMGKTVIIVAGNEAVLRHPVLMATVPFRYNVNNEGFRNAMKTLNGLYGVYTS